MLATVLGIGILKYNLKKNEVSVQALLDSQGYILRQVLRIESELLTMSMLYDHEYGLIIFRLISYCRRGRLC